MLSRISDDVKEDGCRQIFARVRDADKRKEVFKVNKGGKSKAEEQTNFVTFFVTIAVITSHFVITLTFRNA